MFALNCVLCDAVDSLSLDDVFARLVAFVEKKKNRREVSRRPPVSCAVLLCVAYKTRKELLKNIEARKG